MVNDGCQVLIGPHVGKDKGWAWVVTASAFVIFMCGRGHRNAFGIIFPSLLQEFKQSKGKTALVGSLSSSLIFFGAPFVGLLIDRIGIRKTSILGGLMFSMSLLASSYGTSVEMLLGTYGILLGLSTAVLTTPCPQAINRYFEEKAHIGLTILAIGVPSSTLIFTPLYVYIIDRNGWRTLLIVLSIVFGVVSILAGAMFVPTAAEEEDKQKFIEAKRTEKLTKYWKILKSPPYLIFLSAVSINCLALGNFETHLVEYATELNIPWRKASMLPILLGLGSIFGRLTVGIINSRQCISSLKVYQIYAVIGGCVTIASIYADKFWSLSLVAFLQSAGTGGTIGVQTIPIRDICGKEFFLQGLTILLFVESIVMMIGPPLVGLISDISGDYRALMYLTAGPCFVAAIILLAIPFFKLPHSQNTINITTDDEEKSAVEKNLVTLIIKETSV